MGLLRLGENKHKKGAEKNENETWVCKVQWNAGRSLKLPTCVVHQLVRVRHKPPLLPALSLGPELYEPSLAVLARGRHCATTKTKTILIRVLFKEELQCLGLASSFVQFFLWWCNQSVCNVN
jgi:hypothetical protein